MMTLNEQINAAGLRERIVDEDYLYPKNTPGVTVCVLWLLGGGSVTGSYGPDASVDASRARDLARDVCLAELLANKKAADLEAAERRPKRG
jgi:hypothetical protein